MNTLSIAWVLLGMTAGVAAGLAAGVAWTRMRLRVAPAKPVRKKRPMKARGRVVRRGYLPQPEAIRTAFLGDVLEDPDTEIQLQHPPSVTSFDAEVAAFNQKKRRAASDAAQWQVDQPPGKSDAPFGSPHPRAICLAAPGARSRKSRAAPESPFVKKAGPSPDAFAVKPVAANPGLPVVAA